MWSVCTLNVEAFRKREPPKRDVEKVMSGNIFSFPTFTQRSA